MRTLRQPVVHLDTHRRPGPGLAVRVRVPTGRDRQYGTRTLAITLEQLASYACAASVAGRVN